MINFYDDPCADWREERRKWPYKKHVIHGLREAIWRVVACDLRNDFRIPEIADAAAELLAELIYETAPTMTDREIEALVTRMATGVAVRVAEMRREHADGRHQA